MLTATLFFDKTAENNDASLDGELGNAQKHGISHHLVCFLHFFFPKHPGEDTRKQNYSHLVPGASDWRNAAEGAGDGLAVGAGCPICSNDTSEAMQR